MPVIEVRALGPLGVNIDGVPAPRELLWKKHLALMLYLLRSPRRTRERDHLIGLLWADSPEAKARQSLNEALRLLRHYCGRTTVDTPAGTEQVRLGDEFTLDADEFEAAHAAENWARASALAAGEFAEGFTVRGASAAEDWLGVERRHFRDLGVNALVRQAETLLAQGATTPAAALAERALALDGLSERAARSVMRCRLLAGDRRGAAECGARFSARVAEELGAEASAELRHLSELATAPSPVVRPGRIAAQAERTPFVGREAELGRLLDAWTECRTTRRPTLAIVSGDAGAGISRLLEEVSARLALDGASVAGLRAVDADQDHDASLISGLATGGLSGLPGVATAAPGALAVFARRFPGWAERYAGAGQGGDVMELETALAEVVRATAEERPLLLLIDDAHRLDAASLKMLPRLLRATAGLPVLLLIGVNRDVESTELIELRRLVGQVPGVTVTIGALPARALGELAAMHLPAYTAVELDRLVRRVSTDSGGMALLAVEILRAVSRGMQLDSSGKAWPATAHTLDQTLPAELPDAVVAALRINVKRLSKPAIQVLAAASLAPDRVSPEMLAYVTEQEMRQVDEALDELEWQRWLVAEGRGYSFAARLVRRVLSEDLLTPGQRRRLRERIEGWPGDPPG
jgi:DNA-binding SARP family transcriptional activator